MEVCSSKLFLEVGHFFNACYLEAKRVRLYASLSPLKLWRSVHPSVLWRWGGCPAVWTLQVWIGWMTAARALCIPPCPTGWCWCSMLWDPAGCNWFVASPQMCDLRFLASYPATLWVTANTLHLGHSPKRPAWKDCDAERHRFCP